MQQDFKKTIFTYKHFLAYSIMLIVFLICITLILYYGSLLQSSAALLNQTAKVSIGITQPQKLQQPEILFPDMFNSLYQILKDPLSLVLLQFIVIITTARAIGFLFKKISQPAVIGEMVAGIILGPSLLGILSPGVEAFFFPSPSLNTLNLFSQIGIILLMFVVGMDLNIKLLRQQAKSAVMISHASILLPFLLGTALSLLIYRSQSVSQISFSAFALFIGISMSITAFPVLARIIEDRGLSKTSLGNTAIACAAIDDVTAWCILAVVVAMIKTSSIAGTTFTILMTLTFICVMIFLIRPKATMLFRMGAWNEARSKGLLAGVLTFTFVSALFTEVIGIHAIFGAFVAGIAIPTQRDLHMFLKERIETFSSAFLVPLFFAFTGLRTQIGLLVNWQDWLLCAVIIGIAIVGKLGGSMLAARWTGMSWLDSASIGTLMNSRGLVELIALSIGYDLGILTPRIYTMMVIMALVTTIMTGPLLSLLEYLRRRSASPVSKVGNTTQPLGR
jgi:Kef-type K+ transport system membrane component KefB